MKQEQVCGIVASTLIAFAGAANAQDCAVSIDIDPPVISTGDSAQVFVRHAYPAFPTGFAWQTSQFDVRGGDVDWTNLSSPFAGFVGTPFGPTVEGVDVGQPFGGADRSNPVEIWSATATPPAGAGVSRYISVQDVTSQYWRPDGSESTCGFVGNARRVLHTDPITLDPGLFVGQIGIVEIFPGPGCLTCLTIERLRERIRDVVVVSLPDPSREARVRFDGAALGASMILDFEVDALFRLGDASTRSVLTPVPFGRLIAEGLGDEISLQADFTAIDQFVYDVELRLGTQVVESFQWQGSEGVEFLRVPRTPDEFSSVIADDPSPQPSITFRWDDPLVGLTPLAQTVRFDAVKVRVADAIPAVESLLAISLTGQDIDRLEIEFPVVGCRADLDGDGVLNIFDFLEFQNLFDLMDPAADFDGDGDFTIFDFLAFQNEFDAGCA